MMEIHWPPKPLHPNSRPHWAEKARAAKKYRAAAHFLALAAGYKGLQHYSALHLDITFHPPSARHHDRDNLLAAMKNAIDGIADATGVDDRHYTNSIKVGRPEKGGKVIINITGLTNEQESKGSETSA